QPQPGCSHLANQADRFRQPEVPSSYLCATAISVHHQYAPPNDIQANSVTSYLPLRCVGARLIASQTFRHQPGGVCNGTNVNVSTSTNPRSVNFSEGITESERKLSVIQGCSNAQPNWAAAVSSL